MSDLPPNIFLSGLPGCGKSHFGRWLAQEQGYLHIDFEKDHAMLLRDFPTQLFRFIDIRTPEPLIEALRAKGAPVVFNWGFPMSYLDVAEELGRLLIPVWLWAEPARAKASFMHRADVPEAAFDRQMAAISTHSSKLESIFGPRRIQSILSDGAKVDCEALFSVIQRSVP